MKSDPTLLRARHEVRSSFGRRCILQSGVLLAVTAGLSLCCSNSPEGDGAAQSVSEGDREARTEGDDGEPPVGVVPEAEPAEPVEPSDQDAPEADVLFGGGADTTIDVGASNPSGGAAAGDGTDDDEGGDGDGDAEPVAPIVSCAVATGAGDAPMIDDFEDGDMDTLGIDGRSGGWYAYNSDDTREHVFEVTAADGLPAGSQRAMHTSGRDFQWAGIGFGLRWGTENDDGEWVECVYDATAYQGVRFWARGDGSARLTVSVPGVIPEDDGGTCVSDCWNNHGVDLTLRDAWTEHFIPFTDMVQPDYGEQLGPLDPAELRTMQFEFPGDTAFDLWIDELQFYALGADGGDPVEAPAAPVDEPMDEAVDPPADSPSDAMTDDEPPADPQQDAGAASPEPTPTDPVEQDGGA